MLKQILWTACVTPFKAGGKQVDYQSLEKLLRSQAEQGNGVLLLGSTGEGLSLSDEERKEIIRFSCSLDLDTEIMSGVPSHNLQAALEWLEFCSDMPLAGYLLTTPIYTKPGVVGQIKYFEVLLNRAKHPAMLYNIPGRAAIRLHPETVQNLAGHPNFMAIKDSSGMVDTLVEYKIAASEISVYCGDDYMMPAMAAEGAVGLVSVASNSWPLATRNYVQASLNGKRSSSKLFWQACRALFAASNPIPVKALLKDIGIIADESVRLPLSQEDLTAKARQVLLDYHQLIEKLGD